MAPEVFLHEPYNTKVDVYSFAMICYQLFEGRVPFEGMDAVQAAKNAAMHRSRPPCATLPEGPLEASVRKVRALARLSAVCMGGSVGSCFWLVACNGVSGCVCGSMLHCCAMCIHLSRSACACSTCSTALHSARQCAGAARADPGVLEP